MGTKEQVLAGLERNQCIEDGPNGRFILVLDDERCMFKLQFNHGLVFPHFVCKQWNKRILREILEGLEMSALYLRALGYSQFCVIIPDDDPKLLKFEKLIGFTELARVDGMILLCKGF